MANTPWRRNGVVLEVDSGAEHTGTATVPVSVPAGRGTYWVRSDSPTVPVFTDSAGTDYVLNTGGVGVSAGIPGQMYENLQFYVDSADVNSYPGSGSTVTDLMGNATSGTLTTATFEDGAFNFNAVAGSIAFTKGTAVDNIFTGGGTLMAWIRVADDGEGTLGVVIDTTDGANEGYALQTSGAALGYAGIRFSKGFSGTTGVWTVSTITDPFSGTAESPLHKGSWISIAVTYDDGAVGNTPTFYRNGTAVTSVTTTTPVGTAGTDVGNPLTLGNRPAGDRTLDGQIGVVLLWDRVLNTNEIQRAHSAFAPRFGQGMRGIDGRLIGSGGFTDISGQDVWIRAGDSHSTTTASAEGGNLFFVAGDHIGGGGAPGGRVYISSGGGGNTSDSGTVLIQSGSNTLGGSVTVQVGTQNHGNTPGTLTLRGADQLGSGGAGPVLIRSGCPTGTTRQGALITVRAADGTDVVPAAVNVDGGDAIFRAGDASSPGFGGDCTVRAGDGVLGVGGDLILRGGNTFNSSQGGNVTINGGTSNGTSQAGNITLTGGSNTSASNGAGGDIIFVGGTSVDDDGGKFTFTAGNTPSTDAADPAGGFFVTTGNQTGNHAQAGSGGGDVTFTLGSCASTSTSSTGGAFTLTAGAGVANSANSRGGAINITSGGVSGTTAGAVAGNITISGGQATNAAGTSGTVRVNGGAAGFAGATAGTVSISGGAGNSSVGGTASVTGGAGGGTSAGGAASIIGGAGGGTSGAGGAINITGGTAQAGNSDGGDIVVTGGTSTGTGIPGQISLLTSTAAAPLELRTQATFTGTSRKFYTKGQQTTLTNGTSTNLETLGTLSVDGRNLKINCFVTVVNNSAAGQVCSGLFSQTYLRNAGAVTGLTAHISDNKNSAAGGLATDITFNLFISGNDILLRATNASGVTSYTGNIAIEWDIQEGGFAS